MNGKQVNNTSKLIANTEIYFEVRAPSSTSPPSPRRISDPLELPQRITTTREYITPQSHSSSPEVVEPQIQ